MRLTTTYRAFACVVAFLAGCGGGGGSSNLNEVHFDLGGAVAYRLDPTEGLAGVQVAISGADGRSWSATTSSTGLWSITGVPPGVYSERYDLAEYETQIDTFALEAFGENDVENVFVARPTILMIEPPLRATVDPFAEVIGDGDALIDGIGGRMLVYDLSAGGPITIDFGQRIFGIGAVYIVDQQAGGFATAVFDTAGGTAFTFREMDLAAMNSGNGITADLDPFTMHVLVIDGAEAYTPIHGDLVTLDATARFNVVP